MRKSILVISLIVSLFAILNLAFAGRYYIPEIGRWATPDPHAQNYPHLSPYCYAANNPLHYIDPDGKDITSTLTEDDEGNKHYTITYTATVTNESSVQLSEKQLNAIASKIANQIEKSFTGLIKTGEGKEITWSAKADIVVSDKPRSGDNIIKIVDMDQGKLGNSQKLGSIQRMSADLVKSDNSYQIGRTGAHEFGHGAGLKHPTDPKTGAVIRIDIGNLMQQSKYSKGTFIDIDQIEKMHKLVNFWYGARKKK
jgi:uncharacterized protein RhaS with RHS repeats